MHKSFLENLDLELNNVDQVYNENLKTWKRDNTNISDKDFVIQEIEHLSNINLETISELELEKIRIYSIYLSKIKSQFPWDLEDYYNRYKDTKEFYMVKLNLNQKISYEDFKSTLNEYKIQYYYIWDKLPEEEKVELKYDFNDQLNQLKNKKEATKYKIYFDNVISEINEHFEKQFRNNQIALNKTDNSKLTELQSLFKKIETYHCFMSYQQKEIIEFYNDYSYLKKRLQHEKLIYNITDNDFMKILLDEKLISENNHYKYNVKGKLDSLNKSSTPERENKFNNTFNL